jgi:glycosyltransferase involved in cell wall biosynthesis
MLWHLLTPEYPPDCGGVGDYTSLLADALADAGDIVHVWHPPAAPGQPIAHRSARLAVHVLPDRFGRAARRVLDRAFLDTPGTVLVQYVPGAFGLRGVNVPFCRWLLRTHRTGGDVRVMFHEPFFYYGAGRPWRNALAVTQRLMATLLLRASSTLYVSTEAWLQHLAPFGLVSDAQVLPVPATLAIDPPASIVAGWRERLRCDAPFVVGHFGTYGDHIAAELRQVLPAIWRVLPRAGVLLAGDGSREFGDRLRESTASAAPLVTTGRLSATDAAAALRACDVLIAPFPDGATTRRTSLMASLSSGRAVVTTDGALTERVWRETGAVALVRAGDAASFAAEVSRLAGDETMRTELGARGRRVYDQRFDVVHIVSVLRQAGVAVPVR